MVSTVIAFLGGPAGPWMLAGIYLAAVLVERMWSAWRGIAYDDADALCSMMLSVLNSVVGLVISVLVPLAIYVAAYDHFRLVEALPVWGALPLAFVVHELSWYWDHRLGHRVGLLWAFHSIHHSSNEFNHSVAARGFALDNFPRALFDCAAALMGVPPVIFLAVSLINRAWGIWNHASYVGKMPLLDRFMATPVNHKVHHANQPQYIDRNYGEVLIVWDRLFGTFAACEEPPVTGLVKPIHDNNPLTAQFAGLKQLHDRMAGADRWRDKLGYLWRPPEWSHDGICRSDCPKYSRGAAVLSN